MYGKKPPEQMKKRIIKSMIRQSEYIKIKAIDQNAKEYCTRVGTAEIKKVLLALIKAVRKEMIEYEPVGVRTVVVSFSVISIS